MDNPPRSQPILIIGAGWSGLASAITLIEQGHQVCLLESARHIGGRARSIHISEQFSGQAIDNGQHIMLGAYRYTRNILQILQLDESAILERQSLELKMFAPEQKVMHFKAAALPAPLHLLFGLLFLTGVSLKSRLRAIQFTLSLALSNYHLPEDISVHSLLNRHKQTEELITTLWEPLCLATMNTPLHQASASVFINVLKDSFSNKRNDSDLLFFKHDLTQFFADPAMNYINKHNGRIHCAQKVKNIEIIDVHSAQDKVLFQVNTHDQTFQSHQVILATPAHISNRLIQGLHMPDSLAHTTMLVPEQASLLFKYEPICTVYLQYPETVQLPQRMIGFFNSTSQWAIDRSLNQQPGLIAVVISGPGKHTQMTQSDLADTIHHELRFCISELPEPLYYKIIKEKKATFNCQVNIQNQRPQNRTGIPGLYLAGDYTDTNYPATLEGAIKSGVQAARAIINQ